MEAPPAPNYPPVPYPSVVELPEVPLLQEKQVPIVQQQQTPRKPAPIPSQQQTPAKSTRRPFITPFKPPRPVPKRRLSSSPPSSPRSSPLPKRQAPSSPLTPALLRARPPQTPNKPPFKPPTFVSPTLQRRASRKTPNPAVEISTLERRVQLLRQARRYQVATMLGEEEGEGRLEELCEKWKEAGKAAAEMLWEHAGGIAEPSGDPFSHTNSSGGWSSTWGFANPTSSNPFLSLSHSDPFSSSWGWAGSSFGFGDTESDLRSQFLARVEEEMRESGKSRKEVMDALEMEQEGVELPSLQGLVEEGDRKRRATRGEGGGRKKAKTNVVENEESESEDELMRQLDELIGEKRKAEGEGGEEGERMDLDSEETGEDGGDGEGDREEEEAKWNVSKLMKAVGVDPALFGWDEEDEEFAG